MYLRRSTTMTEVQAIISIVHYYRDMWPTWYHVLSPMVEAYSVPKGRKILLNDSLYGYFKGLKQMFFSDNLIIHPD